LFLENLFLNIKVQWSTATLKWCNRECG